MRCAYTELCVSANRKSEEVSESRRTRAVAKSMYSDLGGKLRHIAAPSETKPLVNPATRHTEARQAQPECECRIRYGQGAAS